MSDARAKPRLLLVFPGPVYDLDDYFGDRLTRLSDRFAGSVVVFGEESARVVIGEFDVTMLEVGGRLGGLFPLLEAVRRRADEGRESGRPYDAVVTYDPLKTGLVGSLVARRHGIPLISEVNGDYADPSEYADIPNPLTRAVKRRLYMGIERFVLRRAAGVKLLFRDQLDPVGGVPPNCVLRVFPNYVSFGLFQDLGETPEVLFVGFPFHRKGIDILIDAFKRVSDDFPEWRLKILGWFPDRRELDEAVAGHPRILVHPPVPRAEVAQHLGRCGIFVLPSRSEAMGRVLLEAMACAKPRIGSAVGGIPTVIQDGVDGLLFRSEDAGELAERLATLMRDPALRRRLGQNAAARARDEFTAAAYFARIEELYSAVLGRTRAQPAGG